MFFVLHHTATIDHDPVKLRRDHIARKFDGAGYHYGINHHGAVHAYRPVLTQGAHARGANEGSVGIVFYGSFHSARPVPGRLVDLASQLIASLVVSHQVSDILILPHSDAGTTATVCPGDPTLVERARYSVQRNLHLWGYSPFRIIEH